MDEIDAVLRLFDDVLSQSPPVPGQGDQIPDPSWESTLFDDDDAINTSVGDEMPPPASFMPQEDIVATLKQDLDAFEQSRRDNERIENARNGAAIVIQSFFRGLLAQSWVGGEGVGSPIFSRARKLWLDRSGAKLSPPTTTTPPVAEVTESSSPLASPTVAEVFHARTPDMVESLLLLDTSPVSVNASHDGTLSEPNSPEQPTEDALSEPNSPEQPDMVAAVLDSIEPIKVYNAGSVPVSSRQDEALGELQGLVDTLVGTVRDEQVKASESAQQAEDSKELLREESAKMSHVRSQLDQVATVLRSQLITVAATMQQQKNAIELYHSSRDQMQQQLARSAERCASLADTLTQRETALGNAQGTISRLEEELMKTRVEQKFLGGEVKQRAFEIKELTTEARGHSQEMQSLNKKIAVLEQTLTETQDEKGELQEQLAKKNQEIEAVENALIDMREAKRGTERSSRQNTMEMQRLTIENQKLQNRCSQQEAEISGLSTELAAHTKSLETMLQEHAATGRENSSLLAELEKISRRCQVAERAKCVKASPVCFDDFRRDLEAKVAFFEKDSQARLSEESHLAEELLEREKEVSSLAVYKQQTSGRMEAQRITIESLSETLSRQQLIFRHNVVPALRSVRQSVSDMRTPVVNAMKVFREGCAELQSAMLGLLQASATHAFSARKEATELRSLYHKEHTTRSALLDASWQAHRNIRVLCRVLPVSHYKQAALPDGRPSHDGGRIRVVHEQHQVQMLTSEGEMHSFGFDTIDDGWVEYGMPPPKVLDAIPALVQSVMDGNNACIFLTGSMTSYACANITPVLHKRVMTEIFEWVTRGGELSVHTTVTLSYVEIAGEEVFDMLGVGVQSDPITHKGKRAKKPAPVAPQLMIVEAKTVAEGLLVTSSGLKQRSLAAAKRGQHGSSVTHGVLTIQVLCRDAAGSGREPWSGKLHVLELASPPSMEAMDLSAPRVRECLSADQSLGVLGQLLVEMRTAGLSGSKGRSRRAVLLRQSQLTRCLGDSLASDKCKVLVLAVVGADPDTECRSLRALKTVAVGQSVQVAPPSSSAMVQQTPRRERSVSPQRRTEPRPSASDRRQRMIDSALSALVQKVAQNRSKLGAGFRRLLVEFRRIDFARKGVVTYRELGSVFTRFSIMPRSPRQLTLALEAMGMRREDPIEYTPLVDSLLSLSAADAMVDDPYRPQTAPHPSMRRR